MGAALRVDVGDREENLPEDAAACGDVGGGNCDPLLEGAVGKVFHLEVPGISDQTNINATHDYVSSRNGVPYVKYHIYVKFPLKRLTRQCNYVHRH